MVVQSQPDDRMLVEQVADGIRARHRRLASVNDWDCTPEDFEPARLGDYDIFYCENCNAVVYNAEDTDP